MKKIAVRFQKETAHQVNLSFGSSGKFFAQISNDAPYDIFFSADQQKPKALESSKLSVPDSRFTYAIGSLALWSADSNLIDNKGEILKSENFNKLAIANPKLAPYGVAAIQALKKLKLYKPLSSKLVQGENIAQTYQFVATGNAQLGLVALSQIMQKAEVIKGSAWPIPASMHKPIRQDALLLKQAKDKPAAKRFLKFFQKQAIKEIISSYGYKTEES